MRRLISHLLLIASFVPVWPGWGAQDLNFDWNARYRVRVVEKPTQEKLFPGALKTRIIEITDDGDLIFFLVNGKRAVIPPLKVRGMRAGEINWLAEKLDEIDPLKVGPEKNTPCMELPLGLRIYTANNGNLFLRSLSVPCGAATANHSPAAREVTQQLDLWFNEAWEEAKKQEVPLFRGSR